MRENLSIVLVDDEPIIRMDLQEMLTEAGYNVVAQGSDGFEAIELCQKHMPDVVILDIEMEMLDGLSAAKMIGETCPNTAIVMLTAYSKNEYTDKAKDSKVSSYILKPVNEKLLVPNIELAVARNKELTEYLEKMKEANQQLENRKVIERAKGIVMQMRGISEEDAYSYIRNISKARSIAMAKVAEIIIRQHEGSNGRNH